MNKKEIDEEMKRYEKMGFDIWQMLKIQQGLEEGVDVSKYADPEFHWKQMKKIRKELEEEKQKEPEMEI